MTAYANGGSYSDSLIGSLRSRSPGAGHQSTDTSLTPPRSDSRLTTAVAVPGAQVGRGLESRTLMERLQRILAEVDRPRQGQSEAPQRENKSARQQISAMREDLDALTATRQQGEFSRRQLQIADQPFKEIKQELRTAEDRFQKTATEQYNVVEQRLRVIEPKIVAAEQSWRRIDEWRQNTEQHFAYADEQLLATVQRLEAVEQQLTEAVCETFGPRLQIAEQRSQEIKQELRAAQDRIDIATGHHNALEQSFRAIEPKIAMAERSCQRIDEWRHDAEQRFKDTDDQLQGAVQRLEGLEYQLTEAIVQIKIYETKIESCEDRLQRDTGLPVEAKKIFDQQTKRLENVEVSIGALAQEIEHLKAPLSKARDARLKGLQASLTSNRRMQWFVMIAWIMSLLLVGYGGIGSPGFSIVRQYLLQWVPAWL
jgi:predicted  nucleic acid-binding Zn-ribbon protein